MTREAFKYLFDLYFEDIRRYIFYRSGDAELSTDVAQDTFLKIWEKKMKILPGKERGLLFKIAGDLFVTQYRRKQLVNKNILNYRFEFHDISPEETLQFKELKARYEELLIIMPEKQRVVFLMSRMENLKYHEIAERLNISVKAVEKRMKGALEFIRMRL